MKFSIIISTYNNKKLINKCIDSILSQTYNNYEIIVIDDGSTDNTYSYLKDKYKNKIQLFKQKNSGVSSARNYGLSKVTGDYVIFVDSDDWIDNDSLEKINEICQNGDLDLIITNVKYTNGKKVYKPYQCKENNKVSKQALIETIISLEYGEKKYGNIFGNCRCIGGKIYKTKIIKENNITFNNKISTFEDGIFNINFVKISKNIFVTNYSYYNYYQNINSVTHKKNNNNEEKILNIISELRNFEDEKPDLNESVNFCSIELLKGLLKNLTEKKVLIKSLNYFA